MTLERIFNNTTSITLEDIFQSILNEKIDALINEFYDNNKVNFADSSKEEEVA
jgi:SUMO ligase MMS21 Smc5/6 complex component